MLKLITDFPVASFSQDHLDPKGSIYDNSRNMRFNEKIYSYFKNSQKKDRKFIKVLDLGCSGGGAVRDFLEGGATAVGLEGSDASLKLKRGEWGTLYNSYLFTCDITKPFTIKDDLQKDYKFNLITLWEVLEHIKIEDFDILVKNILNHLDDNGLLIVSIDCTSNVNENETEYHVNQKSKNEWIELFKKYNLFERAEFLPFFNDHFIRSKKFSAPNSFNLVFTKNYSVPSPKKLMLKTKIMDWWFGSKIQKRIKRFVLGPSPNDKKI
jgi:SAM-dependent methyltransferase